MPIGDDGPVPEVSLNLRLPAGWDERSGLPGGSYTGYLDTRAASSEYPPRIVVSVSKLTGDVDTEALLDLAPRELRSIRGFEGPRTPTPSTFDSYPAVQVSGTVAHRNGERLLVQKTVVVPTDGGAYLILLQGASTAKEGDALSEATQSIDEHGSVTVSS